MDERKQSLLFFAGDGDVVAETQFFIRAAYYHHGIKSVLRAEQRKKKIL